MMTVTLSLYTLSVVIVTLLSLLVSGELQDWHDPDPDTHTWRGVGRALLVGLGWPILIPWALAVVWYRRRVA